MIKLNKHHSVSVFTACKNRAAAIFVLIVAGVAFVNARADERSPVSIPECREAPVIDGRLDDSAWRASLNITNFVAVGAEDGFPPAVDVSAKLMRNAEWLFIGFDIKHPLPERIAPKVRHRDERVQGENCVKVAFDPGTDGKQWYHIRLSAGNVISDQRNIGSGSETGWNIPMRSKTRITETGWQAEMALPFSMLMDIGNPERAKINLLAYTFIPVIDTQGIATGEEVREVASWAPVNPAWWLMPERFVPVSGLAEAELKAPFLPMLTGVEVGAYRFEDDAYVYDVSGVARNCSSRDGWVNIRAYDIPAAGEPVEVLAEAALPAGEDVGWSLTVPVASVVRRKIKIDMELASGEVVQSMLIENPAVLDMFSAFLDRNYYTTEQKAGLVCRIGLPGDALNGTLLRVQMESGDVLGETREIRPLTEWSFSIEDIIAGKHRFRVEFRNADGVMIADQALTLIKRAPKPGCEWKIDQLNRVILNNGKPFFPFGVCFNATEEVNYKEIGEAGFNSIVYWSGRTEIDHIRNIMQTAEKHGLNVMFPPERFATNALTGIKVALVQGHQPLDYYSIRPFFKPEEDDQRKKINELSKLEKSRIFALAHEVNLERMVQGCKGIMDYPNLIGYNTYDEPFGPNYFDQWVQGFDLYNKINQVDGYHPWSVIKGPPEFDFCELVGTDPYWVPGTPGVRGSPRRVLGWRRYYQKREPSRKISWMVPLAENWSGSHKRFMLPQEQLCQTYLMLIDGVKALFYFVYPFTHQMTFDVLADLAGQMQILGPACVSPDVAQTITYIPDTMENSGGAPDDGTTTGRYPDVPVKLFRNPRGGFVLLAANCKNYPVDVKYTVSLLGEQGRVKHLFDESRSYLVKDGCYADKLENYGVSAYQIDSHDEGKIETSDNASGINRQQSEIAITVSMSPHPDLEVREGVVAHSGRTGMKNIMPNPSFEEASLSGYPDYWRIANSQPVKLPWNRTGREKAFYSLDDENPWHGRHAFRIRVQPNREPQFGFYLGPQHNRPTEYVWSFYMRADRDGVKVRLLGPGVDGKTSATRYNSPIITLTSEWKRYHVNVIVPVAGVHRAYWIRSIRQPEDTTIWVDAMQFERGVTPTEFEP